MSTEGGLIDLVEAAYDLELGHQAWLEAVSTKGRPLFDMGNGYYCAIMGGIGPDGQHVVGRVHQGAGSPDLLPKVFKAARAAGAETVGRWSDAALQKGVATASELKELVPEGYQALIEAFPGDDGMMIVGVDPDGHGVSVQIASPTVLELSERERDRWRMLGIHLAAGHRLRRHLMPQDAAPTHAATEFPLESEALIDPTRFVVRDATNAAQDRDARESLREAAQRVDRARSRIRDDDPAEALALWRGLVRGRWSLVDWFDTDGRRFVVARPNPPDLGDPRGLSEAELQVVTYAGRGESGKLIGYRFGISQQRVSALLKGSMKKLGVRTKAQLVDKMRAMPSHAEGDTSP